MAKKTASDEDGPSDESTEERIAKLRKILEKKYGQKAVRDGDNLNTDGTTLSTGSLTVDIALRKPVPMGVGEIAGGMGAGKTTMAIHICANAQKRGWPTYYIDLERGLSKEFLNRFKELDKEKLIVLEPTTSEDATEMALDIFKTVDHAVVIYDSVPCSIATKAVMLKSMDDMTMGVVAKLMGTFLPKAVPLVHDSKGRLILLNQLRDNLSKYGGRPTPGGNPVEHWTSWRIFLKGQSTKSNLIEESGEFVGKKLDVQIVKNRKAPPGSETTMILNFANGIWKDYELFNVAIEFGIIEKKGAWYSYGDQRLGQGSDNSLRTMTQNKEMIEEIRTLVYGMVGIEPGDI